MSECTAAMVLMNLSHAQLAASASKDQQRMMQFLQQDTQNCPQGKHRAFTDLSSQGFSAVQILREINFGHFEALKTAILTI